MTRISSAQGGLKALLDLAGSTTPKDAGDTAAFNSQLDRFGQTAGDVLSKDGNPSASAKDMQAPAAANVDAVQTGQGQPDTVSALFAALADDTAGAKESASANLPAAQTTASQGTGEGNAILALIAKLNPNGDTAAGDLTTDDLAKQQALLKTGGESKADKIAANDVLTNPTAALDPYFADAGSLAARLQGKSQGLFLISKDGSIAGTQKPASKSGGSPANADPVASQTDVAAGPALAILASPAVQSNVQTPANSGGSGPSGQTGVHTRSAPLNPASFRAAQADSRTADLPSQSDLSLSTAQASTLDALEESASADGQASHTIKMNVTSIESQTHLAPVQHPSPAIQIADFIGQAAGSLPAFGGLADPQAPADASGVAASTGPGVDVPSVTPASLSMVKTLTLSLQPDTLGAVTVTMRLADAGLELKVEAENSSTASLIEKDKDNLSSKLQALGYSIDSLVVQTAALQQSPHLDSSNDQSAAGQGQQAQADASASGQSQNGGRNGNDQSPAQTARETGSGLRQDNAADPSAARPVGDGLYV